MADHFGHCQRNEQQKQEQGQIPEIPSEERFLERRHGLFEDQFPLGQVADGGFQDINRFSPALGGRCVGWKHRRPLLKPSIERLEGALGSIKGCHDPQIIPVAHDDVAVPVEQSIVQGLLGGAAVQVLTNLLEVEDAGGIAVVITTHDDRCYQGDQRSWGANLVYDHFGEHRLEGLLDHRNIGAIGKIPA